MLLSNGQVVATSPASSTLADRTPLYSDVSYYAPSALGLLDAYAAYAQIYKSQLWVGTVVRKLAFAEARMRFEVKRRTSDTDSVNERGPLADLLARPNPRMSGFQLWNWTASTRHVYGEAFWVKVRDRAGRPRELHPMHPTNVTVRRGAAGGLEYVYGAGTRAGSDGVVFPESDVVAFTSYNPDNITRGLSTLESLRMTLLNEDAARRAMASMWRRGARPAMVLTTDQELSDAAAARLKTRFDQAHAGADNVGSTAVFEQGLKPQVVQLSGEEMQYIESRKLNREEVCAAFDVPPPVVHILDHATFSNITEQLRSQYRDTMAPIFVDHEAVVDHQLVPDFHTDGDVFTRFNMEEVLRGDFETKASATVAMRNAGFLTGNESRGLFGLPRSSDPEMDRVYANAALIPLGSKADASGSQPPTPRGDDPVDIGEVVATPVPAIEGGKRVDVRTWMGRLGRARQAGAIAKTWHVGTECVAHATLDGQTVPLEKRFANGARVPGDGVAACDCHVSFGQE